MRSLKISLTLFAALIICIIFNSLYLHQCSAHLSEAAATVKNEADVVELENFWNNNKQFIGLSISETHLDYISRLIISVKYNCKYQNTSELQKDLSLLADSAEDIKRYERFSIENLF